MTEQELAAAADGLAKAATKYSLKLVWPGIYALLLKAPFVAWPAVEDAV